MPVSSITCARSAELRLHRAAVAVNMELDVVTWVSVLVCLVGIGIVSGWLFLD
jgi:hypothetical protein